MTTALSEWIDPTNDLQSALVDFWRLATVIRSSLKTEVRHSFHRPVNSLMKSTQFSDVAVPPGIGAAFGGKSFTQSQRLRKLLMVAFDECAAIGGQKKRGNLASAIRSRAQVIQEF